MVSGGSVFGVGEATVRIGEVAFREGEASLCVPDVIFGAGEINFGAQGVTLDTDVVLGIALGVGETCFGVGDVTFGVGEATLRVEEAVLGAGKDILGEVDSGLAEELFFGVSVGFIFVVIEVSTDKTSGGFIL